MNRIHWPIVSLRGASFHGVTDETRERAMASWLPEIREFAGSNAGKDDLIVRGMRIVNSKRDHYFSRFSLDALSEIAEQLPGAPVMGAHDYRGLPMGVNFAAERMFRAVPKQPRRDSYLVETLFYMVNDEEGQRIARKIDLGVWREVSLGWRSVRDTCSICKDSIYDCRHIPGEVYDSGLAEYEMSGVVGVLEDSFVFRGGQKDTSTFNPEAQAASRSIARGEFLTTRQLVDYKRVVLEQSGDGLDDLLRAARDKNSEGLRANVQALLCSRDRFDSARDAKKWAREHIFTTDAADETATEFRFNQYDPKQADLTKARTVSLDEGVTALVCERATKSPKREAPDDSLNHLFESAA